MKKIIFLASLIFTSFLSNAQVVSTFAGSGVAGATNGTGTAAQFNNPSAICLDNNNNVYVADSNNNVIRKITPTGIVTTLAGSGVAGFADGTGTAAQFNNPSGICTDGSSIYVADTNNNRIRKITATGVVTTFAGSTQGYADGTGIAAQFNGPKGICMYEGFLFLADTNNNRIRRITTAGVVTTFAGSTQGYADGTGTSAKFNNPISISYDSKGRFFVTDQNNNRIRKIDYNNLTNYGIVTTYSGSNQGFLDGNVSTALFNAPTGIFIDSNILYVADSGNNIIRKTTICDIPPTFGILNWEPYYCTTSGEIISYIDSQNTYSSITIYSSPDGLSLNPLTGTINPSTSIPGNYSVWCVATPYGCPNIGSSNSIDINIETQPTPTVNIIQPNCNMSVGQIQVTSPLGSQYEYSLDWDNFQTSPNFTALPPGEYYLIVHLVRSDCYSEPLLVTINSMPMVTMSGTNNICAGEPANLYFYGTPNATIVFNANNGSNQSILIDDSGFAVYTSAPLTTNTSYNLVSITSGSVTCNQNLVNPVLVTVTTCIPNSGFHLNAFLDNNNNGIQDSGEVNVPFGQFHYQVNNTTHNVFSFSGTLHITENNPSTLYSFGFTINSAFSNYFIVNPLNYTNMHISSTGGITNINFAISISSFTDLSITNLPLSEPIPGFNYQHMLLYSNNGLLSASGNINFIKDPAVSMVNVSEPSALINPNGFTYNFTNLPPLQTGTIIATMYVPTLPNVSLGQLLITSASINSTSGVDAIPSNNTSSSYQFVEGSYDPNDIVESHGRDILHSSFSSEDYLFYTIRFENTGNANATNISIDNLLDSKLDESTLEMVSSSHNYIMDRISNTVNWKFNNIQLPPSISNSNVGKGYVMYKIKPKTGYAVGDIIPNTAEIFFDTNPAVVTNTFENEFVSQLSIPEYSNNTVTVYPNPAKEQITVQLSPNNFIKQVELVDILGRIIMTKHYNSSNTTEILSLNEVEKGTYLLEITTNDNQKATKKIIVN